MKDANLGFETPTHFFLLLVSAGGRRMELAKLGELVAATDETMPRHVVSGRLISVAISPRWLRSLILPWDVYYRKCGAKISPLPLNKRAAQG
eukprot:scaffold37213_cov43-Cyclotella_meneghiniana.AAC.4